MTDPATAVSSAAPWLPLWLKATLIGVAGAAGALARWGLGEAVQQFSGQKDFPWGIFVCNVLGCLFFGMVVGALNDRHSVPPEIQLILLTGFFGAFTTFSTFAWQSGSMLIAPRIDLLMLNVGGQLVLGIGFVFVGIVCGKALGGALLR